MLRRYTFKLYPSKEQEAALREQARMCAVLWNALLEMRESYYRRAKQRGDKKTSLTAFDQGKDLTELRRECPEWASMPRGTQERVADMLDLAMKAFFKRASGLRANPALYNEVRERWMQRQNKRRAKRIARGDTPGAIKYPTIQDLAGYPHYKRVADAESVPMREPAKSCWKFTAHSAPACVGEPHARGEDGRNMATRQRPSKGSLARGEEGSAAALRRRALMGSLARGEEGLEGRGWRLTMRGIPGTIKARGKFPAAPLSYKTADVKFFDGAWWFSVCVEMPARREAGSQNLQVEFDLVDQFASVKLADGRCAPGLNSPFLTAVEGEASEASRARKTDEIQSSRDRRFVRFSYRWRQEKRLIAHIKACEARRRREALHLWTTVIVRRASELSVIAPPVKENTKTGRGNAQSPGAEVETIAKLNRHVLGMAPAAAIAMLEYKSAEAGVAVVVERRDDHQIRIGRELRSVAIEGRKTRRKLRQLEEVA